MIKMANHEVPFQLASITKTTAPEGTEGDWYRYVILQGTNEISGVRCGTGAEVAMQVRDMVERLNERRIGKTKPRTKAAPAAAPAATQSRSTVA